MFWIALVKEGLPVVDQLLLFGGGGDHFRFEAGTLLQPAADGGKFAVGQAGHGQWHTFQGVVVSVVLEFIRGGAFVLPAQPQGDIVGQLFIGIEGVLLAQFEHLVQQGCLHA